MRLIDGDKLYSTLYEIRMDEVAKYGRIDTEHCCSLSTALYEIYNAPTIDPVKHGKWIISDGCVCCSECGEPNMEWNYCPNCGAKMEGEENEVNRCG